jgi:hypothetical protein
MPTDSQPSSAKRIYHTPSAVTNHFLLILSLSMRWRKKTSFLVQEDLEFGQQNRVGFWQELQSVKACCDLPVLMRNL